MLKFAFLTAALLLMANDCFAQAPSPSQCQQVREAVARYGYAAARQHALNEYGPDAVRVGDQCFSKHSAKHYRAHYRKHHGARSVS